MWCRGESQKGAGNLMDNDCRFTLVKAGLCISVVSDVTTLHMHGYTLTYFVQAVGELHWAHLNRWAGPSLVHCRH